MKKRLIAIATLAALPVVGFAEGANVSGYADIKYTNDNDMSVFGANAELNVENKMDDKVSVRVDADFAIGNNGGANGSETGLDKFNGGPKDSAIIEQAYFDFAAHKSVTVRGGVFNNPIGMQAEDSIDRDAISTIRTYEILDGQTALHGNNVAGVAAIANVGPAHIIVGALNDIGHNDLEENSYAVVVGASPVEGLDLELGYVTQAENDAVTAPTSAGNVLDVNVQYAIAGARIGLDYLTADEIVDSAMALTLGYDVTKMIGVFALWDSVEIKDGDSTDAMGIGASYKLAKNLKVKAEYYTTDGKAAGAGVYKKKDDDEKFALKFLASF